MGLRLVLQLLVLLVFLGLWTWKLLEPYPVPDEIQPTLTEDENFLVAKTVHICAYAWLAFLVMTLPIARRWRWCLVGLLVLHGIGTEIGQMFIPERHGTYRDMLIDSGGITLGVLAWRVLRWASGGRKPSA